MLRLTVRALFGGDFFTEDVEKKITVRELTSYAAAKLGTAGEEVVYRLMCNVRWKGNETLSRCQLQLDTLRRIELAHTAARP